MTVVVFIMVCLITAYENKYVKINTRCLLILWRYFQMERPKRNTPKRWDPNFVDLGHSGPAPQQTYAANFLKLWHLNFKM